MPFEGDLDGSRRKGFDHKKLNLRFDDFVRDIIDHEGGFSLEAANDFLKLNRACTVIAFEGQGRGRNAIACSQHAAALNRVPARAPAPAHSNIRDSSSIETSNPVSPIWRSAPIEDRLHRISDNLIDAVADVMELPASLLFGVDGGLVGGEYPLEIYTIDIS